MSLLYVSRETTLGQLESLQFISLAFYSFVSTLQSVEGQDVREWKYPFFQAPIWNAYRDLGLTIIVA